ncbi:transcription cofactor HES-6-like [Brienomyrus brachyistius]|uniref:transcription cofactor HES-6-like n=1 Tax=Brienomyrus brachyistius TaxID=42636 RepID=UPI0020B2DF5A|nr:transcription cofactor HES-6-like [Brienomyrus brachyistius]
MAPVFRANKAECSAVEEEYYGIKGDRKARKPLVEKKRRARINESLQELRILLSDTDLQSKMENAEVLEMTVKRVEHVLRNRSQDADTMNREASERFAAGYIQCMHEVHMYVSSCPGIDPTVAAELLNHLLECMPLNEDNFQDMLVDLMSDASDSISNGTLPTGNGSGVTLATVGGTREVTPAFSPAPSTTSSDDFYSDLDETDVEHSHSSSEDHAVQPTTAYFKSIWRPW